MFSAPLVRFHPGMASEEVKPSTLIRPVTGSSGGGTQRYGVQPVKEYGPLALQGVTIAEPTELAEHSTVTDSSPWLRSSWYSRVTSYPWVSDGVLQTIGLQPESV